MLRQNNLYQIGHILYIYIRILNFYYLSYQAFQVKQKAKVIC